MVLHETTSPSSTCPLAPACMQSLCLASLRLRSRTSLQDRSGPATTSLPTPSPTTCDLRNPLPPSNRPPGHPQTDSKYIDSYLPGGSLQVAVSEAPLRILPSNGLSIQGRFRYSPRTYTALGLLGHFAPCRREPPVQTRSRCAHTFRVARDCGPIPRSAKSAMVVRP